jgi:hypothetical protein
MLLRMSPRLRLASAGLVLGASLPMVAVWGPAWLGVVTALIAGAIIGTLTQEYGPGVAERVAGADPIGIHLGADGAVDNDGWTLYMPRELEPDDHPSFNERPSAEEVRSWFIDRGAYDVHASRLRLSLLGRSREPVQVREVRAAIRARGAGGTGSLIAYPSAGENRIVTVDLDLDQETPRAHWDGRPYFDNYFLSLAHREAQELRITAHARDSAVEWDLEINYTWRGDPRTVRIDNSGEPFRTIGSPQAQKTYHWQWWEPTPSLTSAPTC